MDEIIRLPNTFEQKAAALALKAEIQSVPILAYPTKSSSPKQPSRVQTPAPISQPTDPRILSAACLQAIENCSNDELAQKAIVMSDRLMKLYRIWMTDEDDEFKRAKDAIDNDRAEDSQEYLKEKKLIILRFTTQHLHEYAAGDKQQALELRNEIVNRFPAARQLDGYYDYDNPGNVMGMYAVAEHMVQCAGIMNTLRPAHN